MTTPPEISERIIYAGDDTTLVVLRFLTDNTPTDLTGWAFTSQWRPFAGAADATALDLTVDVDAPTSLITISLTAAQARATASNATPARGVWDLQGTHATEGTRTWARGTTRTEQDVTR